MTGFLIVSSVFVVLTVATLSSRTGRDKMFRRNFRMWLVDVSGLFVQGTAIPLLQAFVLVELWAVLAPSYRGVISLPGWCSFLLSFALIDYVYYWNHRMLHSTGLWKWHRLHHSSNQIDVLVTSRNSLLTPVFIIYVWGNSLFVYLLNDPQAFLIASALGAALDLWRHSGFDVAGALYRILSPAFIFPQDHAWHHSAQGEKFNFGANFKIWDQLHGTFLTVPASTEFLGHDEAEAVSLGELFWPRKENTR